MHPAPVASFSSLLRLSAFARSLSHARPKSPYSYPKPSHTRPSPRSNEQHTGLFGPSQHRLKLTRPGPMFIVLGHLRSLPSDGIRFNKGAQHVLDPYFTTDEFFERGWEISYIENHNRGFFLVPYTQVRNFLREVHEDTGQMRDYQAVCDHLRFNIGSDSTPTRLGTISSKSELDKMVEEHGCGEEGLASKKEAERKRKLLRKKEKQALAMMGYQASVRCARQHLGLGNKACAAEEQEEVSFDREKPVIVSIDIEAWERDQSRVTEIGISTLDTANIPHVSELPELSVADLDLENLDFDNPPPRTRATAICELMEHRHLRIRENKSLRNGDFVADAADRFDFGTSEWVELANIPVIVAESLRHLDAGGNKRKIILVGHDVKQDVTYLRKMGYDVWNIKDLEVMDTTSIHKGISGIHENRGLGRVLDDMGIIYWNLHNAGNDAAYTLHAFVHLADKGVPSWDTHNPALEDTPQAAPTPPLIVPEGQYPDYEDLVEAGCISYSEPAKNEPGARPPKKSRGKRNTNPPPALLNQGRPEPIHSGW